MFLIVVGHIGLYGRHGGDLVGKGTESCTIFATDTFVLLSGWYGIKFRWSKIIRFMGLGLFVSLLLFFLAKKTGIDSSFKYSLGWFGASYMGLLLLSPIINDCLNDRWWWFYAAAMFLNWLPLRYFGVSFAIPGWGGISFNTLCFMYVTGRVLRKTDWVRKVTSFQALATFTVLMVINIVWAAAAGFSKPNSFIYSLLIGTRDNNSPLAIALAVSIFLMFRGMVIQSFIGRISAFIAPSMFSVYLLHEGCNGQLSRILYNKYLFCDLGETLQLRLLSVLLSATIVMTICVCVDLVRRYASSIIVRTCPSSIRDWFGNPKLMR